LTDCATKNLGTLSIRLTEESAVLNSPQYNPKSSFTIAGFGKPTLTPIVVDRLRLAPFFSKKGYNQICPPISSESFQAKKIAFGSSLRFVGHMKKYASAVEVDPT